jgi:ABC-type bacteriocin/lantibiotic exporter with double-glycine peptidase domain
MQGIQIISPLVVSKIIDSAIYFKGMEFFLKYALLGITLNLIAAIVMPTAYYLVNKIWTESSSAQKKRFITRLPILKHEALKNTSIGYLLQLIESDLESTQSLVISDFIELLNNIIYFVVVFIIVLKLHFILSLMMICVVPPLVIASKIMIPKIQKCRKEFIEKSERVKNTTNEVFNGSLPIKLNNAYNFINNKVNDVVDEYQKIQMKYVKLNMIQFYLLTANLLNMSNMIVTLLGAYLVIRGYITVGVITALLAYFSGLWGSYNFFINFWKNLKVKMISVDRIICFLELPTESAEGIVAEEFTSLKMDDLSYKIDDKSLLTDVSLTINKNDKILITGDNGSGKSTFARLLIGLMTPTTGYIYYNSEELSGYNLHSLRERVGYIPAEPYIFSGNLEDNFFGESKECTLINTEKYIEIAKEGSNLSSGEKKRLQLAIGILQKRDIYILDEPLNFVDELSKKEIVETIQRDFKDKTLIIISHENKPFDFCEKKYFMENGTINRI